MKKTKSATQLNREIAEALKREPTKRHHVSRRPNDYEWDIATDAILEDKPEQAAQIVREIREKRGMEDATTAFLKAVREASPDVRATFYAILDGRKPQLSITGSPKGGRLAGYEPLPHFYEMVRHPSDMNLWFKATEELKKPGYKGVKVEWYAGDRKPKKAKASTIQRIDIDQHVYKSVAEADVPPEVLERFFE